MKNVTFIISRLLDGGIDTVLVQYLNNLDRKRYRPSLIIVNNYDGMEVHKSEIAGDVKIVYLTEEGLLTSISKKKLSRKLTFAEKMAEVLFLAPIRRAAQRWRIKKLIADADLVVDMDCTSHTLLRCAKIPCIAFFHFSIKNYCHNKESRIARLGKKFKEYDHIVMVSEDMEKEAITLYPELRSKISTIYNPLNIADLQTRATAFNVEEGEYLLSVARLEEHQKDYSTLIKAYGMADKATNGSIAKLRIIGKGRDEERLKKLAEECGVADKVIFMGHMQNPMPWIANCKAMVLSSKFEGLACVLIEALLLGRPLVASDCPVGSREVLDDGKCGTLVPVGDTDTLAAALIDIDRDEQLRESYRKAGINHSKNFVWETSAKKFDEVCGNLPQTRGRKS
ncbi:MAG: glycosyltransferase [Marinilabiliaceae bacterium]